MSVQITLAPGLAAQVRKQTTLPLSRVVESLLEAWLVMPELPRKGNHQKELPL